jgi:hypothetical protein
MWIKCSVIRGWVYVLCLVLVFVRVADVSEFGGSGARSG